MTKEDAIKSIEKHKYPNPASLHDIYNNLACDMAIKALGEIDRLKERVAKMAEGGWHNVKTDPPKEDCDCIVVVDGESEFAVCRVSWNGVVCFETPDIYESEEIKGVTHWMPKPEPPKEGGV